MSADLFYAVLHFAGAFAVFGALFAQAAMLLTGPGKVSYARLARMDIVFGAAAAVTLTGGLLRVFLGARGPDFYLQNPAFHLKLTLFVLVALISIWPTLTFIRWRKAAKRDPAFMPPAPELKRVKMLVHVEMTLLAVLVVAASVMARWYGL